MSNYQNFLEGKVLSVENRGFEGNMKGLHKSTKPHQLVTVNWAMLGGCRAIFASFGLGKTQIQLELANQFTWHQTHGIRSYPEKRLALIVMPLGVKQEFKHDAERLGIEIDYVRNDAEAEGAASSIHITNYERVRDNKLDVSRYQFVSLDEASILRTSNSKTHHSFIKLFEKTPFKYVCTATPSPNDYMELVYYANFLGIMDKGQCKTRFFQRDSTKADKLTLYPHKEREFWLWVSSWAIFITKPSDLGFSDEGYNLPELQVNWHRISVPGSEVQVNRNGELIAFHNNSKGLKSSAEEKRRSLKARVAKAKSIIGKDKSHYIIWHHLEAERRAIEKAYPYKYQKSVFGSQKDQIKEDLLIDFANGKYRILATKPEIAGSGCNFQRHCHKNIFLGVNYKFNDFIQAIHRTHRFQQEMPVEVHIIYTANEDEIIKTLKAKWKRHNELMETMREIIKKYGLTQNQTAEMRRSIGIKRKEFKGTNFTSINNDCVAETESMKSDSVHMVLTSIPFSNHYEYTPSYNDFGHTDNDDHFFAQMDYLTPQLRRVLMPGRIAAIHVKDRVIFGSVNGTGMPTINPFHAKTIFHFLNHGFHLMGQITIETDVVRENNQTYRLGWSEQCKDGTKMGVGSSEYLLIFRKAPTDNSKSYADTPVTKSKEEYSRAQWQIDARGKWNSSGERLLTPDEIAKLPLERLNNLFSDRADSQLYNYDHHVDVAIALDKKKKLPSSFETLRVPARYTSVWGDVTRIRTLNTNQSKKKEQNHICPLQFDICDRAINRWTNVGETILDPFAGIHTVPYRALLLDRKAIGIDLNEQYWKDGQIYCREAEYKRSVPTLFDAVEENR